ncbi:MAG: DUF2029 domain-containing protein [Ardenticatenaceae bacterium]|nr:DUF2029 domain-containing protein [Ardenticatenaceae bacterium]
MKLSSKSVIGFLVLSLVFVVLVAAVHGLFTTKVPGANDFYSRWKGAQLFFLEGMDPYSPEAGEAIQVGMYGRPAMPDEDQVLFVYPFYTAFLLVPLIGLSYDWAQAVWLVVVMFSLIGAIVLCLRLVNWRMSPWLLGMTLLWTVVFYNSARTIILGQFAALVFLWLAGSLWMLQRERDVWAGVLLALTTIKPQMVFLLIPALLLWALGQRRWRFIAGFAAAMAGLLGLSFLLLPGWLAGFLAQVNAYPGYTITGSPIWVLTGFYFPQLGRPVELGLSALAVGYLVYVWWRDWRVTAVTYEFILLIGLTLLVTNLVVVRTATTNYVVLYIPLFWGLKQVANRWPGGKWLVAAFFLLSTVGTWLLFLATIKGDQEHPVNYLPLPFLLLTMLIGWRISQRYTVKSNGFSEVL